MKRVQFRADTDRALTFAWQAGHSMDAVARRLRMSRSTLYRRAGELGLQARQPEKRRKRYTCRPRIPKKAHPLVRRLFKILRKEELSVSWLAGEVGMSREAISYWCLHSSPSLVNIEACFNAVGYRLTAEKIDDA